jgi:hypothetical protein
VTAVQRVLLTVVMDNGEQHSLVVDRPGPTGGNPAFVAQQYETAIEDLRARMVDVLTLSYGRQRLVREYGIRRGDLGTVFTMAANKAQDLDHARAMMRSTSIVIGPMEGRALVARHPAGDWTEARP